MRVWPGIPVMEHGASRGEMDNCSCLTRLGEIRLCSEPESIKADIGSFMCLEINTLVERTVRQRKIEITRTDTSGLLPS